MKVSNVFITFFVTISIIGCTNSTTVEADIYVDANGKLHVGSNEYYSESYYKSQGYDINFIEYQYDAEGGINPDTSKNFDVEVKKSSIDIALYEVRDGSVYRITIFNEVIPYSVTNNENIHVNDLVKEAIESLHKGSLNFLQSHELGTFITSPMLGGVSLYTDCEISNVESIVDSCKVNKILLTGYTAGDIWD